MKLMAISLLSFLLCAEAFAGVKMVQDVFDVRDGMETKKETRLIYMNDNYMKVAREEGKNGTEAIFDAKQNRLVIIDNVRKNYKIIDKEALRQFKAKFDEAMKMLEKMPPEQREMALTMLKGQIPGFTGVPRKIEYKKTGSASKAGQWDCSTVDVVIDGAKSSELCVADPSAFKLTAADTGVMSDFISFIKELTDMMPIPELQGMHSEGDVGGLPVKITVLKNDVASEVSLMSSITKENIADSFFAIPAGYKEEKIMMGR